MRGCAGLPAEPGQRTDRIGQVLEPVAQCGRQLRAFAGAHAHYYRVAVAEQAFDGLGRNDLGMRLGQELVRVDDCLEVTQRQQQDDGDEQNQADDGAPARHYPGDEIEQVQPLFLLVLSALTANLPTVAAKPGTRWGGSGPAPRDAAGS